MTVTQVPSDAAVLVVDDVAENRDLLVRRLQRLRRFAFDKLKIDREFISSCSSDVQSATIVHAVVSIGRALGMKVIDEGVETEEEHQFLRIAGAHGMQGYLFCKPLPMRELKQFIGRQELAVAS